MTFEAFCRKSFGEKSVFDRPQFDVVTNMVKWVALRFGYALFRLGVSANLLDVAALFICLGGFFLMAQATTGSRVWPLLGIGILYFHVFIDFVDGTIAKAKGTTSTLGHYLDEIGCDIDRMLFIVLFGVYAGHPYFILANAFAAGTLIRLAPLTKKELPTTGWLGTVCKILCHKFSLLSVRFMLALLPCFLAMAIIAGANMQRIGVWGSYVYISLAVVWLLLCIPNYRHQSSGSTGAVCE